MDRENRSLKRDVKDLFTLKIIDIYIVVAG